MKTKRKERKKERKRERKKTPSNTKRRRKKNTITHTRRRLKEKLCPDLICSRAISQNASLNKAIPIIPMNGRPSLAQKNAQDYPKKESRNSMSLFP
jgi:hypothetical protein